MISFSILFADYLEFIGDLTAELETRRLKENLMISDVISDNGALQWVDIVLAGRLPPKARPAPTFQHVHPGRASTPLSQTCTAVSACSDCSKKTVVVHSAACSPHCHDHHGMLPGCTAAASCAANSAAVALHTTMVPTQ
jgi:hypothetical protein